MTACLDDACPMHTNHQHREGVEPPPSLPPTLEQEGRKKRRKAQPSTSSAWLSTRPNRRGGKRRPAYTLRLGMFRKAHRWGLWMKLRSGTFRTQRRKPAEEPLDVDGIAGSEPRQQSVIH